MLEVGDKLLSDDVFEQYFCCDLQKCKGICCVVGESGAPLEEDELKEIEEVYPKIKHLLSPQNIKAVEEQGFFVVDEDGDYVTPLVGTEECAFSLQENGITFCAIEKIYFEGKTNFRKPISCQLYPIRITSYDSYDAVNYDKQPFCNDACLLGSKQKLPVYKFLKEPLIRKYGEQWYKMLEEAAVAYEEYKKEMMLNT